MPKRANHAGAANACHPCNQLLSSHADLAKKLEALEKKYDVQFKVVFDAIRQLMKPSEMHEANGAGRRRRRCLFHRRICQTTRNDS
jgi:hypothetical protein